MQFIKTLIATAVLTVSGAVTAAPTTVNIVGATYGSSPMVSTNSGASFGSVNAYEFVITSTDPNGTFATFCLEPFEHLTTPWVYDNAGVFTVAQADALSKLFTGANWQSWNYGSDGVTTALQVAGLQLGIWEIANETTGTYDFGAGSFQAKDDGFAGAAMAFAASAYNAGDTSMAGSIIRLSDREKQDLVIAVPEPTTYALMLAGLASIGFVARRRRNV